MKRHAPISSIYSLGQVPQSRDEWEEWARIEKLRRAAWRRARIVAVGIAELPEPLRTQMQAWARERYGE